VGVAPRNFAAFHYSLPSRLRLLPQGLGGKGSRPASVERLEQRTLCDATVTVGVPALSDVSRRPGQQSEGTIAIDPTNADSVFAASNEAGFSLFGAHSTDGGVTWTGREFAGGGDVIPQACCDPSAAWDDFGNLFFAYLAADVHAVVLTMSTDGGRSFRQVATFRGDNDQPTVAVGAGSVWVAFNQDNVRPVAHGARVTGPGRVGKFGRPRRARAPGPPARNVADVAVGPGGQVLLTYQTPSDEGPSGVFTRLDPDGLGPRPFGPPVLVTETNVGDFDHVPPQNRRTIDAEVDLDWDTSGGAHGGRVYLAYNDETPDESGDTDVLVRYSDDDGLTWSAPTRLNDDPTNARILPRIAVDPTTGALGAAWHDARNDDGTGTGGPVPDVGGTDSVANNETQFFATVAVPAAAGVLTVSPNVIVGPGFSNAERSRNGNDYGDYLGLDFRAGVLMPTWADNSNATGDNPEGTRGPFDLYAARIPVQVNDPAMPRPRRLLGQFGRVGKKRFVLAEPDGTKVTLSLQGGGTAYAVQGDGGIDLVLRGVNPRSTLRITARGGDRRARLGDLIAPGSAMRAILAPAADVTGTLSIPPTVRRLRLGSP
jgi:hypothetical protein